MSPNLFSGGPPPSNVLKSGSNNTIPNPSAKAAPVVNKNTR